MRRLDFAIRTTAEYIDHVSKKSRKKYDQFFTSKEIAVFMVELFEIPNEYQMLSTLDSGTGSGILSVALLERLQTCLDMACRQSAKKIFYEIVSDNYISSRATDYNLMLCAKLEYNKFDFVIGKSSIYENSKSFLISQTWRTFRTGFCRVRNEMRTLVGSRMQSVTPTGKTLMPGTKIINSVNEDRNFDRKKVQNAEVHCDDYLAKIVSMQWLHPEQEILMNADGSCELHVAEMPKFHLITWIMRQCVRVTTIATQNAFAEIMVFAKTIFSSHTTNQAVQ